MEQQQRDLTMSLSISSTTTGGPVELTVPRGETVDGLRTRISQKLRLPRNRTVLLHKDRQLTAGKLLELGVKDGSKLTLVPVIEAGLVFSTARAERTMMDVLESLTESQISDFLSGKSHLTISLGIGGHVMYVQLQLSAQDVKTLQQDGDVRVRTTNKFQNGPPPADSMIHPGSASTDTAGFTTSSASQTSSAAPGSAVSESPIQLNTHKPLDSVSSHSSTTVPSANCHPHPSLPHSCHSVHTSLSGCPHPRCPRQAATPVCLPAPTGSSPGPPSPVPASTVEKSNVPMTSTAELCKQPGAVIESFENHSPGVFSGTFSGTLAPYNQTNISHPQRGISIILQILSDLLRAAFYHQGAPPTLSQHHFPDLSPSVNPVLPEEEPSKTRSKETFHLSTEEDQTLHCKLEHLQSLMHQRRLRRLTRSHLSQTSHPYQHRQHHL